MPEAGVPEKRILMGLVPGCLGWQKNFIFDSRQAPSDEQSTEASLAEEVIVAAK